jgi:signal transduction histidine kinase
LHTAAAQRGNRMRAIGRPMLYEFIVTNREEIVRRCRALVGTRSVPSPTETEIDRGVTALLDQLSDALRRHLSSSPDIARSAIQHGHKLQRQGCTLSQVVHDYGAVRQAVIELAVEMNAPISTDDLRLLNHCLDHALADAVTEFGREQNQSALAGEAARGNERAAFMAHEMRNLLNTAIIAFDVLKTGSVSIAGSTGAALYRSLMQASALTRRSLAGVRLNRSVQNRERFLVSGLIEELAPAATLEGNARGIGFNVAPVEDSVVVEADRQVLSAVVMNLLQNAFKFTRPSTTVTLSVGVSPERVLIEIQDECGGLPSGNVSELFRPFEQRGVDRTGLGLGLAFSQWGVEANNGRIRARSLPDRGCVFTVDLPRIAPADLAML